MRRTAETAFRRPVELDGLRRLCEGRSGLAGEPGQRLATGWNAVDDVLSGGLAAGVHEFLGIADRGRADPWTPPLSLAAHLARRAMEADWLTGEVVWIGRPCFPYPAGLPGRDQARLLARSIFVKTEEACDRLWAIDLATRSAAVALVVADGRGLDRTATQRIQMLCLARERLGLLLRPERDLELNSASQSRWLVRPLPGLERGPTVGIRPQWELELLRCKGLRPGGGPRRWAIELDHDSRHVRLSAPLGGAARAASPAVG